MRPSKEAVNRAAKAAVEKWYQSHMAFSQISEAKRKDWLESCEAALIAAMEPEIVINVCAGSPNYPDDIMRLPLPCGVIALEKEP